MSIISSYLAFTLQILVIFLISTSNPYTAKMIWTIARNFYILFPKPINIRVSMSDLVLKSALFTALNFKYSQESVVRFIGKRNVPFFDCHRVPEKTLIKLLNHAIKNSDEAFHISYSTYKASGTLFITPEKLSSKPYWFNQTDSSDYSKGSTDIGFLTLPLTRPVVKKIGEVAKELDITKSQVVMLSILTEFSPNPWIKLKEPAQSFIECIEHVESADFVKVSQDVTGEPTNLTWLTIAEGMKKIVGDESCDQAKINAFGVKARTQFAKEIDVLKDQKKYNRLKFKVTSRRADGNIATQDDLPVAFNVRSIDKLFVQNMEYYKHALYLEVYDPFDKDSYTYYPTIIYIFDEGKNQSMFLSLPLPLVNWLNSICSGSLRSRNSTIRQAIHNFLIDWEKQWKDISAKQKLEVLASLNAKLSNGFFKSGKTVASTEQAGSTGKKAPSKLPKKSSTGSKVKPKSETTQ